MVIDMDWLLILGGLAVGGFVTYWIYNWMEGM